MRSGWNGRNGWINNAREASAPRMGPVTLAADGGVHVAADAEYREVPLILPYGVSSAPPEGSSAVLMEVGGVTGCVGVLAPRGDLEAGEVRIASLGGAQIVLRNDGSVTINGVTITKSGVIRGAVFETMLE